MRKLIISIFIIQTSLAFGQSNYSDSLIAERKKKEQELTDPAKGVLTEEDLTHFKTLHYFFIDTNYRVKARFEKSIGEKFEMPTSTERKPIYRRFGYLYFELNGTKQRLTVFQNMELRTKKEYKNYFFVPFRDSTSGDMTYGGGRYLDLTILKNQTEVLLDFNLAYNPYCAYSHRYSCPIPPEENKLDIFIYSGEKSPIYTEE